MIGSRLGSNCLGLVRTIGFAQTLGTEHSFDRLTVFYHTSSMEVWLANSVDSILGMRYQMPKVFGLFAIITH